MEGAPTRPCLPATSGTAWHRWCPCGLSAFCMLGSGVSFSAWVSDLKKVGLQGSSSLPSFPAPFYILHVGNPSVQVPALQPEGRKLCASWPLLCPVPTDCGNSWRPTHLSPPWPKLLGLLRRGNSLLPHPPFALPASRTPGPSAWLCALVWAPGPLWVSVSPSVRVSLYQLTTLCPLRFKVVSSSLGAAAAMRDRTEHSRDRRGSEEGCSGLTALTRSCLCDRAKLWPLEGVELWL